ncbi:ATP synthase-coupling factor 6, mitochondrial [Copidosoma floridanum]|uniref:ATP synthase-coupling factor 6, mitochondrial n=1 Tax=Copidosoma floridanum TaxID=29053 RepID=UPI0006C9AD2D|nr:ATP synthase-coupling factor 6, mitochondrial [Copidosoma floridanum]XP_014217483.1 ATP synthase-coupling factor 6, mitochondrial [Copidosoma floridanum]XP_014217484.1 ATP synthase-coupling factor 6, mitochondrial [Copidosoma floridanum]
MLSQRIVVSAPRLIRRNFGIAAPMMQAAAVDPIQQLFVDKIREYKSQSSGGKLTLPPEIQAEKKRELEKLAKQYGGDEGADMTAFPKFSFPDPKIEVNPLESTSK